MTALSNSSPSTLSSKFKPFLLSDANRPDIKAEIDTAFRSGLIKIKDNHIFEAGDWVAKTHREGVRTTYDTALYRIRKARKIKDFISQNRLEAHFAVPEKYLYWNSVENRFYVIARKLELSAEVAEACFEGHELESIAATDILIGQVGELKKGAPRRELTTIQAVALAKLSFYLGLTDLSYNNIHFTKDGRVAIIDTEPLKRVFKKALTPVFWLFNIKGAILLQQSLIGCAKLKLALNPPTRKEVEKIERREVLQSFTRAAIKVFCLFGIYCFAEQACSALPVKPLTLRITVLFIKTFTSIEIIAQLIGMIAVFYVWRCAHQGVKGAAHLARLERLSYI